MHQKDIYSSSEEKDKYTTPEKSNGTNKGENFMST